MIKTFDNEANENTQRETEELNGIKGGNILTDRQNIEENSSI